MRYVTCVSYQDKSGIQSEKGKSFAGSNRKRDKSAFNSYKKCQQKICHSARPLTNRYNTACDTCLDVRESAKNQLPRRLWLVMPFSAGLRVPARSKGSQSRNLQACDATHVCAPKIRGAIANQTSANAICALANETHKHTLFTNTGVGRRRCMRAAARS